MDTTDDVTRRIHALSDLLQQEDGLGQGAIAETVGLSRQAFNAAELQRTKGKGVRGASYGLAVVAAGMRNGRVAEALSVLLGKDISSSTSLTALALFPDITSSELSYLLQAEESLGKKPLPGRLVLELIQHRRAP